MGTKKLQLISNWRKAYKMFSVQSMGLATAIISTWATIPDDMKKDIPTSLVYYLVVAILILGIAGRLVDQPSTK